MDGRMDGRTDGRTDGQRLMRVLLRGQQEDPAQEDPTQPDLDLVKRAYASLPSTHRAKRNLVHGGETLRIADAEWADRFLHPCDRAYTVPQVM
jgi:hypothetical protein